MQSFAVIKERLAVIAKDVEKFNGVADCNYYIPPLVNEVIALGEGVWRR